MSSNSLSSQGLLVDAPAPVLKPKEKVLIDLSNTPDLIKTVHSKAFGGQVRDQVKILVFLITALIGHVSVAR